MGLRQAQISFILAFQRHAAWTIQVLKRAFMFLEFIIVDSF